MPATEKSQQHRAATAARPLGHIALRGSLLTGIQVVANKVLATVAVLMLGALLTPEEFGLAGFAASIGAAFILFQTWVFVDVAIADAAQGFPELAATQVSALVFGIVQAIAIIAAAPLLQNAFHEQPGLGALLIVVAFRPLSDAIGVAALARLKIDLRFQTLALVDGTTAALGSTASVALALSGAGPFAVIAPPIATAAARGIVYMIAAPGQEKFWSNPAAIRIASRRFIKPAIAAYLTSLTFLADSLILGAFVAEHAMGIYAFSFNLAVQTTAVLSVAVASTVQPIFAAMGPDRQRQAEGLLRSVRLVSVIAVPASAIQATFCVMVFSAIWGDKWASAVPVFMVLSIGQAMVFTAAPSVFLLKAQGRFGTYLRLAAAQLVFTVSATLTAVTFGAPLIVNLSRAIAVGVEPDAATPLAVACTTALGWAVFSPLAMRLACRQTTIGWGAAIGVMLKPWIVAAPVAILGALICSSMLKLANSRLLGVMLILVVAILSLAVSLMLASRLYATTKCDLSTLIAKLARRFRSSMKTADI